MTEQQPLSDGRVSWLEEECQELVKIYRQAQATQITAREQILRTLNFELSMDMMDPAAHREQVEQILDRELDRVYRSQQVESTDTQR